METFNFEVKNIKGEEYKLEKYQGKPLLIVNTASKCGFTPQYDGLEELHQEFKDKGLQVLGFPCNQFGGQEPGNSDNIEEFCRINHGVTFPIHEKVEVNGKEAHPLFNWLKEKAPGLLGTTAIKWNFTKFLVNKERTQVIRFAPKTKPIALKKDIEEIL